MAKPYNKTGKVFECKVCGKEFYRTPGQIKNGATKTCSKACLAKYHSGENHPFWNKSHSEETKRKISESRKNKALGNKNAKGYKHTASAKKKIGEASKKLWLEQRNKMLECKPAGWAHANYKPAELRRHRKQFTSRQKKEWSSTECQFCGCTDDLVLDHIIPVFDGGTNVKENAQTLCRACNLWKLYKIDLPRYNATLAIQGD